MENKRKKPNKLTALYFIVIFISFSLMLSLLYPFRASGQFGGSSSNLTGIELVAYGTEFNRLNIQHIFSKYSSENPSNKALFKYYSADRDEAVQKVVDQKAKIAVVAQYLSDKEIESFKIPAAAKTTFTAPDNRLMHVPISIGGVGITYNFKGKEFKKTKVRLTPELLNDILAGSITKWNDPKIVTLNKELDEEAVLPDMEIKIAYIAGSNDVNYIFSGYMSDVSPGWKKRVGVTNTLSIPNAKALKSSFDLMSYLNKTAGSLGITDYAMGTGWAKLKYVRIKNKSGRFVKPTNNSIEKSVAEQVQNLVKHPFPDDGRKYVWNSKVDGAYPITGLIYAIAYNDQKLKKIRHHEAFTLAHALMWVSSEEGQKYASQQKYPALPAYISKRQRTHNTPKFRYGVKTVMDVRGKKIRP